MFVAKRMTPNPITVESDTSVMDAADLMHAKKIRRLPVVDNGKLVGIVTDRDLREVGPSPATSLSVHELNYLLAKMKISDVMTKNVLTVNVDATIEEAALLMYKNKIGAVVAIDQAGKIAGIITETDVFKLFVDLMGLPSGMTRITLDVTDQVGVLSEITAIFRDENINIKSLTTFSTDGRAELVIRADVADPTDLVEALKAKGYPVLHVARIKA